MATIARRVTDLDGAQSVTGYRDVKILQEYASLPYEKNMETLKLVESKSASNFFENDRINDYIID